ncbi:MAG: hypothetical protein K2I92_09945, partial [Muribaculaceae bacterium]|nr:hypothetical protein [Muribaculaceae bacterium]
RSTRVRSSAASYGYKSQELFPHACKTKAPIFFNQGDADFNSLVNVLDIQALINHILDRRCYGGWLVTWYDPINFTAANLYEDEIINVQDLVRLVDLILESEPSKSSSELRKTPSSQATANTETSVYIDNGYIIISSYTEIAAFDIMLDGDDAAVESVPGFAITKHTYDGRTRLVGYSMSGTTLPIGCVRIGSTEATDICHAMLADVRAKEVPAKLNVSTTGVSIVETDDLLNVLPEAIHLSVPAGDLASWSIATAEGLILHSGVSSASSDGIFIPFKPEKGQLYIISIDHDGKKIHKKFIMN